MSQDPISFKERLDEQHQWPDVYTFKFIVPSLQVDEVKKLFPGYNIILKPSSKGKYTSATIEKVMQSSDEVLETYEKAHRIKNIIML